MKKGLLLIAGLLLAGTMASAAVVGTGPGDYIIDDTPEELTLEITSSVSDPIAAWWRDEGFFGSRTRTIDLGPLSVGQPLPSIDDQVIYIIAPFTQASTVQVEINTTNLTLDNGTNQVIVPIDLKERNSSQTGQTLVLNPNSIPPDGLAVAAAEAATGDDLSSFGGEIVDVRPDTTGLLTPAGGPLSGSAVITVELLP